MLLSAKNDLPRGDVSQSFESEMLKLNSTFFKEARHNKPNAINTNILSAVVVLTHCATLMNHCDCGVVRVLHLQVPEI
jgi:hypothetical protein